MTNQSISTTISRVWLARNTEHMPELSGAGVAQYGGNGDLLRKYLIDEKRYYVTEHELAISE
jgi:hypothetical protein